MKLIEGRYYETVDGITVGPMVEYRDEDGRKFYQSSGNELAPLSINGLQLGGFQKWNSDGSIYAGVGSELPHVIVKQVAAPGFTLEVGATYETVDGDTVGPLVDNSCNYHWPFSFGEPFLDKMYYKPSGYSCPGTALIHKDGQDLIHKVEANIDPVSMKIELDKEAFQNLISEAAKDFEESANKLLAEMAEKEAELRAAKEAFNILHREKEELAKRNDNQFQSLRERRKEVESLQLEVNGLKAELSDAEDTIAAKTDRVQRSFALIERTNARNLETTKKNEALGLEVLRLNEKLYETGAAYYKTSDRKIEGDNRLRKTRLRLKLANERADDAEEQLKAFNSGKVIARNAVMLLGILAIAFASGGFFF